MDDFLPVLVTKLPDAQSRAHAVSMALAKDIMHLALVDPPIDMSPHVIELYAPGWEAPLLLLCDPEGPPSEEGFFPLRLRPLTYEQAEMLGEEQERDDDEGALLALPMPVRERDPGDSDAPKSIVTLTARHTADLTPGLDPALFMEREEEDKFIGRAIAGGKFVIQELLGKGGAGKVYKARHRELRKAVALKVLHPFFQRDLDFCARFYGEALAASKLDHPNVLRILDFGQEPDGLLYIAMEFLDGRNLQSVITNDGALPLERIADVMMQVCAALTAAHEQGIVHRDIKPDNIVLVNGRDDDGRPIEMVKVCDFGIAQRNAVAGEDTIIPSTDGPPQLTGTPEYMSPEQGRGEVLDERSDIYACGITLYALATGKEPFDGPTPMAILLRHFDEAPKPPSEINPDLDPLLEQIIMKALRKRPSERQQTAREMRSELKQLLEPVMVARPPSVVPPPPRRELLDASALPPLTDPISGFGEFFIALAGAVSRTGYYERGHPESHTALKRLAQAANVTLNHRGELSFARGGASAAPGLDFSVFTGVGELSELRKLLPGTLFSMYAEKFGEAFARRNIVAFTLEDGVDGDELGNAVELLSGPEVSADVLRKHFDTQSFTKVKLLFASDLLGRERRLPWQVDLCISRLARDLRRLPMLWGADVELLRGLRVQLIGDVVRALSRPSDVKLLLANADLVAHQVEHMPEFLGLSVLEALIAALPRARCIQVAGLILTELEEAARERLADPAGAPGTSSSHPAVGANAGRTMIQVISARFLHDRSVESDDLLRLLHARSLLSLPELPPDLQAWIRAEQQAEHLFANPDNVLRAINGVTDITQFASEIVTLERSARTLARRGQAVALWAVVSWLKQYARRAVPGVKSREAIAARALRSIEDPTMLASIAAALLTGPPEGRDAARLLIVHSGVAGAHAMYAARAKIGSDASARPRFVAAIREIGRAAWPALAAAIERAQPVPNVPFDAALAEDLLRAVPELQDDQAGSIVTKFVRHGGPAVCKAAVTALGMLWGARARPLLVGIMDHTDDGVRLAALGALRRVGGIDENVVGRIDRLLSRAVPAGDDLRAGAAAALADATAPAHPAAIALLRRALLPHGRGVLAVLRGAVGPQDNPLVILAIARALIAMTGPAGVKAVEERAAKSENPLREQLLDLLDAAVGKRN